MQQGVQVDAVPLPEREVSSHLPLLFPGPPQAARDTKCLRPTCLFFAHRATAGAAQNRGHVSKVPE